MVYYYKGKNDMNLTCIFHGCLSYKKTWKYFFPFLQLTVTGTVP